MNNVLKYIVLGIMLMVLCRQSFAQSGVTEIGKPAPAFTVNNVTHFSSNKITSKDLMGKWTIFDFWSRSCMTCIEGFPKVNKLQHEFSRDIQFMFVASDDRTYGKGIQEFYERFAKTYSLIVPSAYDSALFKTFRVTGLPQVTIIDPRGIVRAITTAENLNSANLRRMIAGDIPYFRVHPMLDGLVSENQVRPDLVSSEQDPTVNEFRSVFSKWNPRQPILPNWEIYAYSKKGYYRTTYTPLNKLYNIAYLGLADFSPGDAPYNEYWRNPVIDTPDSIPFHTDYNRGEGLYNYSLTVPREHANVGDLQKAMQADLQKYFGYEVSFETRPMPCYELVKLPGKSNKLATSGKPSKVSGTYINIEITNSNVKQLVRMIAYYQSDRQPFFDETGITENIDITLDAVVTDFEDLRKSLNANGLELVKTTRPMKVMVIR